MCFHTLQHHIKYVNGQKQSKLFEVLLGVILYARLCHAFLVYAKLFVFSLFYYVFGVLVAFARLSCRANYYDHTVT